MSDETIEKSAAAAPRRRQHRNGPMLLLSEVWNFMKVRKRFWLAPIIIALILLSMLMFLANSAGVVSPFVYMM